MASTGQNINARGNIATDPIRNFRFVVEFQPIKMNEKTVNFRKYVGFTSVSGLAISTESIPYREGGFNTTVHQIPGQSTFSPVTFQRGVMIPEGGANQNWDWMRMLFQTVVGDDLDPVTESFRADIVINVLNHPVPYSMGDPTKYGVADSLGRQSKETTQSDSGDVVVAQFRLYNAWPTSIAYSDLNAGDNALMVEQMTVVHEGMDVKWGSAKPTGEIVGLAR